MVGSSDPPSFTTTFAGGQGFLVLPDAGGAELGAPVPALAEPAVPLEVWPGDFSGAGEGEQSGVAVFL